MNNNHKPEFGPPEGRFEAAEKDMVKPGRYIQYAINQPQSPTCKMDGGCVKQDNHKCLIKSLTIHAETMVIKLNTFINRNQDTSFKIFTTIQNNNKRYLWDRGGWIDQ